MLLRDRLPRLFNSRFLIWVILATGSLLRLAQYSFNRSLWYDEALLALNVLHRSWSGLLKPLDYNQGAPIGFLFLQKLSTEILGGSEFGLRAVPLLAGLGSLFAFWRVADQCLPSRARPIAFALFSVSFPLIYYSSEVKQYSTDVLVNLLLLLILLNPDIPPFTVRQILGIGIAGATAIWCSHPASFVLASAGITWTIFLIARRKWDSLPGLATLLGVWAISFAGCYLVSLRRLSHHQILVNFWRDQFPQFPLWSFHNLPWLNDRVLALFKDSAGLTGLLGAAFFVAGCGAMFLRSKKTLGLLTLPAAAAALASALHTYPLAGRLMLFFVPNTLLLVAEGVIWIADRVPVTFSRLAAGLLTAILFAQPITLTAEAFLRPRYPDDIKPSITYIITKQHTGDSWYVYHFARFQFWYYTERLKLPTTNVRIGIDCDTDWQCYAADLEKLRGTPRVWLLFSHIWIGDGVDEEQFFLRQLDGMGKRLDTYRSTGARAYLYDLSTKPVTPPH